MSSLHARLLDATTPLLAGEKYSTARLNGPLAALRAAVELHAPETTGPEVWCPECDYASWPCSTIRVIADALGVAVGDQVLIEKESPTNG